MDHLSRLALLVSLEGLMRKLLIFLEKLNTGISRRVRTSRDGSTVVPDLGGEYPSRMEDVEDVFVLVAYLHSRTSFRARTK